MIYPYIHKTSKKSKIKGLCKICGNPKSDTRIDVANNIFRGDDSVFYVHRDCLYAIGKKMFIARLINKQL